jgi:hypothetical protein
MFEVAIGFWEKVAKPELHWLVKQEIEKRRWFQNECICIHMIVAF